MANIAERRVYKLLRYLRKRTDLGHEVCLDGQGLLLSSDGENNRKYSFSDFPYKKELCRNYLKRAEEAGYIEAPEPWNEMLYRFKFTDAGYAFLSEFGWWRRQVDSLKNNVVTVVVSVVTSLLVAWSLAAWGPSGSAIPSGHRPGSADTPLRGGASGEASVPLDQSSQ